MKLLRPANKVFSIIALCLIFFASCKKSDSNPSTNNLSGVYVAGSIDGRAVVWKDGIPTFLTAIPIGYKSAYALKVLIYKDDVYVLGYDGDPAAAARVSTIKLWKNGVVTNITSGLTLAYGHGLEVHNNDVYILGSEDSGSGSVNKIWLNGVATTLPMGTFDYIAPNNIKVINGDVYVSGFGTNYNGGLPPDNKAIFWKNGIINILTSNTQNCIGSNIFVTGNDIYMTGYDNSKAVYWKNGVITNLALQSPYSLSRSNTIFVENNNVYAAGDLYYSAPQYEYRNAVFWKNNTINLLTNYSSHLNYGVIVDMFVKNDIVYTVGYFYTPGNSGYLYFQNNMPFPLSTGGGQDTYALGIFVQ